MRFTDTFSRPWHAREVDRLFLLLLAVNLVAAGLLGVARGQPDLAGAAGIGAFAVAALAVWLRPGSLVSSLAVACSLTGLVALQIHLGGGSLIYHLNVFVSLSLLLAYRDWRPIACMTGLFALHHIAFDRMLANGIPTHVLPTPDPEQIGVHLAFLALQGLALGISARVQQRASFEARELEFLVNAMGREGRIRLNLDVIRAETPAGQRLQHVQQRMAAALNQMHEASQQIKATAQTVETGSSELMQRTETTANDLKNAAVCLDQISVIVQDSTEASNEAKAVSGAAVATASQGDRMVNDVVTTMQEIASSSNRITDIVAMIDSISFQTNILALNAAVEAARAGEQGRGFAVVASEVRHLASRSAAAAREIKSLIGASAATIETGTRQVSSAGETVNELVSSVKRVGELFEAVTANTTEHMQGLSDVTQSIQVLSDVTRQNVSVAERAGFAAAELNEQAARLAQVLDAFKLGQGTGLAVQPPAAVAIPATPVVSSSPSATATAPTETPAALRSEPKAQSTVEFF